jgi:hypothetical protein
MSDDELMISKQAKGYLDRVIDLNTEAMGPYREEWDKHGNAMLDLAREMVGEMDELREKAEKYDHLLKRSRQAKSGTEIQPLTIAQVVYEWDGKDRAGTGDDLTPLIRQLAMKEDNVVLGTRNAALQNVIALIEREARYFNAEGKLAAKRIIDVICRSAE